MFENYRRDLSRWIATDRRPLVAQRCWNDIAGRLEAAGACKEQHMGGIEILIEGHEWRLATLPPSPVIVRIKRQLMHAVTVDAVAFADDDLAVRGGEELSHFRDGQPIGIAENAALGAPDRIGNDDRNARGDCHNTKSENGPGNREGVEISERLVPYDDSPPMEPNGRIPAGCKSLPRTKSKEGSQKRSADGDAAAMPKRPEVR